jgi:ATP-binding cassette subfamily F protein uup
VGRLSGGERARILIARRMLEPADLLILDEPTNDLDIPTLEVLEESLLEFSGAIAMVTHDRYLLDRVSTALVALDGRGGVESFAELAQWQASRTARDAPPPATRTNEPRGPAAHSAGAKRLTYRDQREWDAMDSAIEAAEAERERRRAAAEDPAIVSDPRALTERYAELAAADAEIERLYARWSELEALRT